MRAELHVFRLLLSTMPLQPTLSLCCYEHGVRATSFHGCYLCVRGLMKVVFNSFAPTETPTYTLYTATQMVALFPIGTRVVRGADFVYSHPGSSGVGNVTSAWSAGYVKVAWGSSSTSYTYAMGAGGLYELYRLSGMSIAFGL